MKKFFIFCLSLLLINACSDEQNSESASEEIQTKEIQMFNIPSAEILNQTFSFTNTDSETIFTHNNPIINAINNAIKCTLSPHTPSCASLNIPKFILMEDESLQRPSKIAYKVTKIKPLAGGILHIYTQSQCNNNWFGLCQGNIIYVLQNKNDSWYVSDIFALENTK